MKKVFFAHDRQESPEERKSYLELTGYEVFMFHTSRELVDACRCAMPDLVILDALVPGKNGFDTARTVRETLGPAIPIVLCTRIYKGDAFREEAKQAGCDGFLLLPVQMGEFLACMQNVSQTARARAAQSDAA